MRSRFPDPGNEALTANAMRNKGGVVTVTNKRVKCSY